MVGLLYNTTQHGLLHTHNCTKPQYYTVSTSVTHYLRFFSLLKCCKSCNKFRNMEVYERANGSHAEESQNFMHLSCSTDVCYVNDKTNRNVDIT